MMGTTPAPIREVDEANECAYWRQRSLAAEKLALELSIERDAARKLTAEANLQYLALRKAMLKLLANGLMFRSRADGKPGRVAFFVDPDHAPPRREVLQDLSEYANAPPLVDILDFDKGAPCGGCG